MLHRQKSDGGKESGVSSWGIEIKWLFSIVLLRFEPNERDNHHSHAFNALTLWLKGSVFEERIKNFIMHRKRYRAGHFKFTSRANMHKILCEDTAWAISIRGPWEKTWTEYNWKSNKTTTLTHGRKVVLATSELQR